MTPSPISLAKKRALVNTLYPLLLGFGLCMVLYHDSDLAFLLSAMTFSLLVALTIWIIERKRLLVEITNKLNDHSCFTTDDIVTQHSNILPNCINCMENINNKTTSAIVDFCKRFSDILSAFDNAISRSLHAAEHISEDDSKSVLHAFNTNRNKLKGIIKSRSDSNHELLQQLKEVGGLTRDLKDSSLTVTNIMTRINVLATSSTIEAAIADNKSNHKFIVVAKEVKDLARTASNPINQIAKGINILTDELSHSMSQSFDLSLESDEIDNHFLALLDNISLDLNQTIHDYSESSTILIRNSETMKQAICEIMVALQFHDRASQILQQCKAALLTISDNANSLEGNHEFPEHLLRELESLKLFDTSEEKDEEIEFF